MILYKYVTFQTLEIILSKYTLRLNNPALFNDPFDCGATLHEEMGPDWSTKHRSAAITNAIKMNQHRNMCGVLCLTRNPLNTLMWAHYCSNHTGAVIGIDVGITGLEDESQFIINVKNGSVIYTSVRPSALDIDIPPTIDSKTDRSILEKMYLQKSTHWAYEEEVRVVKVINPTFTVLASLAEGKSYEDISIPPLQ